MQGGVQGGVQGEGQVQLQYRRATLSVLSFHSFLSAAPSLHLSSAPDLIYYVNMKYVSTSGGCNKCIILIFFIRIVPILPNTGLLLCILIFIILITGELKLPHMA